jgi:hypothetical protein
MVEFGKVFPLYFKRNSHQYFFRFVLSGANIMCPGLTHPNAMMTPVEAGTGIVSNAALFCIFVSFFTHTAHAYSTFINSFDR